MLELFKALWFSFWFDKKKDVPISFYKEDVTVLRSWVVGTESKPRKIRFINQLGETRVGSFYFEWKYPGLILTPVPNRTSKLIFPKKKSVVRFITNFKREPEYGTFMLFKRNVLNKWVYVFSPHKTI